MRKIIKCNKSIEKVYSILDRNKKKIRIKRISLKNNEIIITTKVSAFSWGEKVKFTIDEYDNGILTSKAIIKTQLTTYFYNKRNIKRIIEILSVAD